MICCIINRTYGLFKASLRISHFGTNQSKIQAKPLNPKVFYSDPTFDLSYANVRILQELKETLFGAKMLIQASKIFQL